MPRVKMLRNIGLEDARVLQLDPKEAREGKEIEVSSEQAEEIVRCGLGEMVEKEEETEETEETEQQELQRQEREQRQREQQQRQQAASRPPSPPVPPRK